MSYATRAQRILINSYIQQQDNESLNDNTSTINHRLRKGHNPPKYFEDFTHNDFEEAKAQEWIWFRAGISCIRQ